MADTLLPAAAGTFLLEEDPETGEVYRHPVIGFAYVSGHMLHPLVVANVSGRAVQFPGGVVTDRILRKTFSAYGDWLAALQGGAKPSGAPLPPPPAAAADPAHAFKAIGVSTRAANAIMSFFSVTKPEELAGKPRHAVAAVKGVSRDAMQLLDNLFAEKKLFWAGDEPPTADPAPMAPDADDDDDDEGIL